MWLSVMAKISCPGIVFPDKEDSAGGTLSFYCYGLGIALSVVLLLMMLLLLLLLLLYRLGIRSKFVSFLPRRI